MFNNGKQQYDEVSRKQFNNMNSNNNKDDMNKFRSTNVNIGNMYK